MINIQLNKPSTAAIDENHVSLILGSLLSVKAKNILEIGIGTGFVTDMLLKAIEFNGCGNITSIDNYHDLGGNLSEVTLEYLQQKRQLNIIAPVEEKDFVLSSEDNTYDFLVSDGDHHHSGEWVLDIFRIMKPNSFMFFHDVNNPGFPGLMNYKVLSDEYNKPNYLFTQSSRKDEECHRGLLMVINKK
jgi:predicted O-methyltransferase YrrM